MRTLRISGAEGELVRELWRSAEARDAAAVGVATGAYGISFGALAVASGLSVWQACALSVLMFTGASQFAFVGVVATGGGAFAAVVTAWLLGLRNAFYGIQMARLLGVSGLRRVGAAQLTIDESVAMALGRNEPRSARRAFWLTGIAIFLCWNVATLGGALAASGIAEPRALGLDAAVPAAFLALLWPRLRGVGGVELRWIAVGAATLAVAATPITPNGVPVLMAAVLAICVGVMRSRADSVPPTGLGASGVTREAE